MPSSLHTGLEGKKYKDVSVRLKFDVCKLDGKIGDKKRPGKKGPWKVFAKIFIYTHGLHIYLLGHNLALRLWQIQRRQHLLKDTCRLHFNKGIITGCGVGGINNVSVHVCV